MDSLHPHPHPHLHPHPHPNPNPNAVVSLKAVTHGSSDSSGHDIADARQSSASSSGNHLDCVGVSASPVEEIVKERRRSNVSECSVEVDLELGIPEKLVHFSQSERDCRICHMSLDVANLESGVPIDLGCSCKDDLAAAHKHCAETWFKIKGNKICEVCGSIACNVAGNFEVESMDNQNQTNGTLHQALRTSDPRLAEARSFWQGHRFLNFLLACMVFAFIISWLFHFNVPST